MWEVFCALYECMILHYIVYAHCLIILKEKVLKNMTNALPNLISCMEYDSDFTHQNQLYLFSFPFSASLEHHVAFKATFSPSPLQPPTIGPYRFDSHLQRQKRLWSCTRSLHCALQWPLHLHFSNFHSHSCKARDRYQGQRKYCSSDGFGLDPRGCAEWQHSSYREAVTWWSGVGGGRWSLCLRSLRSKPHFLFRCTPVHSLSSHNKTSGD